MDNQLNELDTVLNENVNTSENMPAAEQNNNSTLTTNDEIFIRPEIRQAVPDRDGILPLIDLFIKPVLTIKHQFNLPADINDIWLHINHKIFADVPQQNLGKISPYNVLEHLYTCIDNNLNPLKPEVASYYVSDYKTDTHSIKTQILLEGYNKIYSTHPQSDGLDYIVHPDIQKEFIETVWETNPQTRKREAHKKVVVKMIPRMVECRIYRKDMAHPTIGFAFPDDIGNTGAWQGHPSQMMCNRAFTRAVRMAYNLEGTSAEDVAEIKSQHKEQNQMMTQEQEIKYEKNVATLIEAVCASNDLQSLNAVVGQIKPAMKKLPDLYRQRLLTKINEVNMQLRQNLQNVQMQNVAPQVQEQPQNTVQNDQPQPQASQQQPQQTANNSQPVVDADVYDFEQMIS